MGTLSVAPEFSEVAALVERARSTLLSGGGRHGVLVDIPAGLPQVMADRRRVVQVLSNLFANAARPRQRTSFPSVFARTVSLPVAVFVTAPTSSTVSDEVDSATAGAVASAIR